MAKTIWFFADDEWHEVTSRAYVDAADAALTTYVDSADATTVTTLTTYIDAADATLTTYVDSADAALDTRVTALETAPSTMPADDTHVWMPLTTVVGGVPELVWDANDSLIPTLTPI